MLLNKKVVVVFPAYRAEKTVEETYNALPHDIVDEVLLVDDAGGDKTSEIASKLGIKTFVHKQNLGYGGNQKTCYSKALELGADIVVMVHPDYQYDPRLVAAMAGMVASGIYDAVLASRIIGGRARKGGMPLYKYIANRGLTATQNLLMGTKHSEFHTGYRAFSREVIENISLLANSDDFVFDNQMIAQIIASGYQFGEISCPTKYFEEASSINFKRSCIYGLGVLWTSLEFRLWKWGMVNPLIYSRDPKYQLQSSDGIKRSETLAEPYK